MEIERDTWRANRRSRERKRKAEKAEERDA